VAVVIRSAAPAVWRAALPATAHPQESSSPARAFLVTRPGPFARAQGMTRPLVYQPVRALLPSPGGWHWAASTKYWLFHYIDHLDAQHPGPLTQDERQQARVVGSAWFERCPFQQWIHCPINGGGRGYSGD
jgi:hypothetical protein